MLRRVVGLTPEEVCLTLAEGKDLLGELGQLVLQTQMEEYTTETINEPHSNATLEVGTTQ